MGTIVAGAPVYPAAGYSDSDVFTVDQKLKTPYIQNWNQADSEGWIERKHELLAKLAALNGEQGKPKSKP